MLHDTRQDWQANYKSMSPSQLVAELERVAKQPHLVDDQTARITFLSHELALRRDARTIILLEA